jgi:uncharacterized protein YndB with AHSA1/START domain
MSDRTIAHGDFVIERSYPVPPAKVFAAWADPRIKARWFGGGEESGDTKVFEFKVGGREYSAGTAPNGVSYTFDVTYKDIVPDSRIIYAYEMSLEGKRISVSVAAIEFVGEAGGTRMIITEHGVFLDGLDNVKQREEGTIFLTGKLGDELKRQAAN